MRSAPKIIIQVAPAEFSKPKRVTPKRVADQIYIDPTTPKGKPPYTLRYTNKFAAKRTTHKLAALTLAAAKDESRSLLSRHRDAFKKLIRRSEDPFSDVGSGFTFAQCADLYERAGCPKQSGEARTIQTLREEKAGLAQLREFRPHLTFDQAKERHEEICRELFNWKKTRLRYGRGNRQVDKLLQIVSNTYKYASQFPSVTGVTSNPFEERPVFCLDSEIKRCRDRSPRTVEEVHACARYLFESRRSEQLGWHLLLILFTGMRANEPMHLRLDAKRIGHNKAEPGYLVQTKPGHYTTLYIYRSKGGTMPYVEISPHFRSCLTAFFHWHKTRLPDRQEYLTITPYALTPALARICPAIAETRDRPNGPITAHSVRSFYGSILLSQGVPPGIVGARIGDRSGEKLIISTYGDYFPERLNWIPRDGPPAWQKWLPKSAPDWSEEKASDFISRHACGDADALRDRETLF